LGVGNFEGTGFQPFLNPILKVFGFRAPGFSNPIPRVKEFFRGNHSRLNLKGPRLTHSGKNPGSNYFQGPGKPGNGIWNWEKGGTHQGKKTGKEPVPNFPFLGRGAIFKRELNWKSLRFWFFRNLGAEIVAFQRLTPKACGHFGWGNRLVSPGVNRVALGRPGFSRV